MFVFKIHTFKYFPLFLHWQECENKLYINKLYINKLYENKLYENRLYENRLYENRLYEYNCLTAVWEEKRDSKFKFKILKF